VDRSGLSPGIVKVSVAEREEIFKHDSKPLQLPIRGFLKGLYL
jgi:hypothetical protein